ncbi:hypothetical protein Tco_0371756 [Tanacetum coccineum]
MQFKLQKVWILVDLPSGKKAIGTKWVFKNKRDERSIVDRGTIEERRNGIQPLGFVDPAYPNKVYKIIKALYGLHQAPRAWDSHFELEAFSDSDYGGTSLDRKLTTGGCQLLGRRLISWQCKKQTIMANSTTEVEYVTAANYCRQTFLHAAQFTMLSLYITATVAGKPVSISEASIRSDLQFNDAAGIDPDPSLRPSSSNPIPDSILEGSGGNHGGHNSKCLHEEKIGKEEVLDETLMYRRTKDAQDEGRTSSKTLELSLSGDTMVLEEKESKEKGSCCDLFRQQRLTPSYYRPAGEGKRRLKSRLKCRGYEKVDSNWVSQELRYCAQCLIIENEDFVKEIAVCLYIRKDEGAVLERPSETQPTPFSSHPSEDPIEPQPDPSLRPSSSNPILDSILEGSDLKSQIKQLKMAKPVIPHHNAWIKSVSMKKRLARKKSLKKKLIQKESGRTSSKTLELSLSGDTMVLKEKESKEKGVSIDDPVSTAQPKVSTDKPKVSTDKDDEGTAEPKDVSIDKDDEGTAKPKDVSTDKDDEGTPEPKDGNSNESATSTMTSTPSPTVFGNDETIAQVLITMSQNKPLPKIDPKAKGKKKIEEEDESDTESEDITEAEKKFKMLANDEEIARKVQEEWEEEENKKRLAEEEPTMAAFTNEYGFIQARLNADKILAEKLQEEGREKFTIEQRAKFLHDTIAAQRRFLAQQRSEAIRNKLPTRNQLRNQMMTYLKHVGGYKHAQLNKKKFEEIQVMYEKVKRENERFIPIGSAEDDKLIEKMNKKAAGMDKEEVAKELESSKVEGPKENIRKRSGRRLKMKAPKRSKRQKTDSDHEEENQLRIFLKIVPEEEEKIDYEILGTRYPIINWESKFYDYGHFGRELIYYRVFRADGSSRWIKTFSEMIKLFDRMDLIEIHSLVMKRFETTPPEGIDLLLWGDLRTMFESKEDDELWKNQEEWKLQSWIFYENCGVHVLRLEDGTEINMLAERRYPLTKHTLERMMDLRLTVVSDDDTVFDLLRFIEQQIDEFGGQDGSEKDL